MKSGKFLIFFEDYMRKMKVWLRAIIYKKKRAESCEYNEWECYNFNLINRAFRLHYHQIFFLYISQYLYQIVIELRKTRSINQILKYELNNLKFFICICTCTHLLFTLVFIQV